jgi:hypothetical protein
MLPSYSECFTWIKSKSLGEVDIKYFFTNLERFEDTCRKRGITFAKQGMKVKVAGNYGRIVGSNSSMNLDVLFDGHERSSNCHPYWDITYYDDDNNVIKEFKE